VHTDVIAGEIAARQLGLITRTQAIGIGVTDNQIKKRTRAGKWRRVRSGVFTLVGAPVTWEQRLLAVVLAGGPGTVASHFSAAGLHEFPDGMQEALEVTVAPGTQPRLTGVRIHRPARLPDHDVRVVGGIPVTSYARTLVDCTGCMSLGQIARALDAGLVRHDVTLWSVERSLSVLGQAPGRHPSKLRTLLSERGSEMAKSESRPEARVFRVLEASGLPVPTQQHPVRIGNDKFRLDLAYPEAKVAIEYDGWDTHKTRIAFDADRRRDRILQVDGWVVLRLTSKTSDTEIVETIRSFVA
jgi:very-short-patch-repair endonuclease